MPSVAHIHARGSLLKGILSAEKLQALVDKEQRELASDAEIIFAAFALHRTGRMGRGVHTIVTAGGSLTVVVEARDPVTGFDYVRITRFGHRTFHIVPVQRSPATVLETGKRRKHGRKASLRWVQTNGTVVYARSSRGFHPARDWADEAMPEIRERANQRMSKLGREIETAWNGEA